MLYAGEATKLDVQSFIHYGLGWVVDVIKFGVKLFVDYYGAGLEGRSDEALGM